MVKSRSKHNRRWTHQCDRPNFKAGDLVKPNGNFDYSGNHKWPVDEWRRVDALTTTPATNGCSYCTLRVWNPNMDKYSYYNPDNFITKEQYEADRLNEYELKIARNAMYHASIDALTGENKMAHYERTKYFAALVYATAGSDALTVERTLPLRDHKSFAIADAKAEILKFVKECDEIPSGSTFIVLQTVCRVDVAPPMPPIIVTEYK